MLPPQSGGRTSRLLVFILNILCDVPSRLHWNEISHRRTVALSCRWVFPFIGHMGICTSSGIIRDFAGSYFVSVSYFRALGMSVHICDGFCSMVKFDVNISMWGLNCSEIWFLSSRRTTWALVNPPSRFDSHTTPFQSANGNKLICFLSNCRYWKLDVDKVCGNGAATWDKAVHDASEEYKCRPVRNFLLFFFTAFYMALSTLSWCPFPLFFSPFKHNLCLDNCHSHVAMALNLMRYDNSASWNMVNLCARSFIYGKHVR